MKRTIFKKWMVTLVLTLLYFKITIHGMDNAILNKEKEKKETQQDKSGLKCGLFKSCCCKNDTSKNEKITLNKNVDKTLCAENNVIATKKAIILVGNHKIHNLKKDEKLKITKKGKKDDNTIKSELPAIRQMKNEEITFFTDESSCKNDFEISGNHNATPIIEQNIQQKKQETLTDKDVHIMSNAILSYGKYNKSVVAHMKKEFPHLNTEDVHKVYFLYEKGMEWFNNLRQKDKDNVIQFLSQAIEHYKGFNHDVLMDMESKFKISSTQTQQLYYFMYSKENKRKVPESTDIVVPHSEWYGIENLKSFFKKNIGFIILAFALFGSLPVESLLSLLTGFIPGPLCIYLFSNTMDITFAALDNVFSSRRNGNRAALIKQNKSATIALTTTTSIFFIIFLFITSGHMPDILNLSGIFGMLVGGLFLKMN